MAFLYVIVFGLVIGTSIWVKNDSAANRITTDTKPYSPNNGEWVWFGACILLWIVAFPYYLYRRSKMLNKPIKARMILMILFSNSSVIMFSIGCGLVFAGCKGELNEETNPEGSAIRQTVFALQYGFGFVMMALSLILGALRELKAVHAPLDVVIKQTAPKPWPG